MADDFDSVVENVKRSSTWMRIVYMIGFCVVLYVVSVVIWFLTGAQALFSIFTGADNRNLRLLGSSLAEYVNQILKFITYNSENRPFPFSPFPEADEETFDTTVAEAEESEEAASQSTAQSADQFDDLAFLSRQEEVESEVDIEKTLETAPEDSQSLSTSEAEADQQQKEQQEEKQQGKGDAGNQVDKYTPGKDTRAMSSSPKTDMDNKYPDAPGHRNDDQSADKSDQ